MGRFKLFNQRKKRSQLNRSREKGNRVHFGKKPANKEASSVSNTPHYEDDSVDVFEDTNHDHSIPADASIADRVRGSTPDMDETPEDTPEHELPEEAPDYETPARAPEAEFPDEMHEVPAPILPSIEMPDMSPSSSDVSSSSSTELYDHDQCVGHQIKFKGKITCNIDGKIGGHIDIKASLNK